LDWQRDDCLGRRQRERLSEHRREILRPIQCDADGDSNCYTNSDAHSYSDAHTNSHSNANCDRNAKSHTNSKV
jgi:hypothetical protein